MEGDLLIYIILSFVFGYGLGHVIVIRKILGNPQDMIDLLEKYKRSDDEIKNIQELNKNPVEIEVVKEQSNFYLYSKKDKEFLGQGLTIEIALENIRKRYPNKVFNGIIAKEQAEAWGLSKRTEIR